MHRLRPSVLDMGLRGRDDHEDEERIEKGGAQDTPHSRARIITLITLVPNNTCHFLIFVYFIKSEIQI